MFVVSSDWSNESNNSVAALLMPESNDKAPEGAASGSAQPLAPSKLPDTAAAPDGGSEAPAVDPAQARSARHAPRCSASGMIVLQGQEPNTGAGYEGKACNRCVCGLVQAIVLLCQSTELVLACWHNVLACAGPDTRVSAAV